MSQEGCARTFRSVLFLALVGSCPLASVDSSAGDAPGRPISFERRVAAQTAIERVYWAHRIWPADNPSPKPALEAVMTEEAIRRKVEDYLRKSNALEKFWNRPVTAAELQAEMERIARRTRDAGMLAEIFAALDQDPFLIAETFARPTLVERLIGNWYARDTRLHEDARVRAQRALAAGTDVATMKVLDGEYRQAVLTLDADETEAVPGPHVASLSPAEWDEELSRLGGIFATSSTEIPLLQVSRLQEDDDRFFVTAILSRTDRRVTTATVSWPKRPFDLWWQSAKESVDTQVVSSGPFLAVSPKMLGCVEDAWTLVAGSIPNPAWGQTAVWTGSEMIVWGGSGRQGLQNTGWRYRPATDTWLPTSTGTGVPSSREDHTAVWTGSAMIVWGGSGGNQLHNVGGRYDPASDTWVPTSTGANVPSPRAQHTAVWTGSRMIVWGGAIDFLDNEANTGGRYDPSSDSWLPTSIATNVPPARSHHKAVWTGSAMIVWGGYQGSYLNSGGRYDPIQDSWLATSIAMDVPSGRAYHTAIWTGSEMIVWGGWDGSRLGNGGHYDPTTDTWIPTSSSTNVPSHRYRHTAVWTGSEMIVWGGSDGSNFNGANTGGRYDPGTSSWLPTSTSASVPSPRSGHTAVWTGSEMIVWGGIDMGSGGSNTGGRYHPATDSWVPTFPANAPSSRYWHTAVWTGSEMIVWGGNFQLNSGARYAPTTDTWLSTSQGDNVPSARQSHTAIWTGTQMIVWGGDAAPVPQNTGGRYDPATNTWLATSTGASVPAARTLHTAVWTGTRMIVWGGNGPSGASVNTGGRYDPSTDSWLPTSTASVPSSRVSHTAVWTGSEMIVWGGLSSGPSNTGGRYSPSSDMWIATATAGAPAVRHDHTAVWTGSRMIVWGGSRPGNLLDGVNTGGSYDPATNSWLPTSTGANVPQARKDHSAVWTGTTMIVWGGRWASGTPPSTTPHLRDTGGRYSPATDSWLPTSQTGAPSARADHTGIWTDSEMIVWGGLVEGGQSTDSGARYCACSLSTRSYRDADGDGHGDAGIVATSCDGSVPPGYVSSSSDCDDTRATTHPGATETCNGIDEDCDGQVDEDALGEDSDGDGVRNACDDCALTYDPGQSDTDEDGEGDVCDSNDGLIWEWRNDTTSIHWQSEAGPTSWNVYVGDLGVLRSSGPYTQLPGSNPLAERHCGETSTSVSQLVMPDPGQASFSLVTGVTEGIEGSLGTNSAGTPRPNANPCP